MKDTGAPLHYTKFSLSMARYNARIEEVGGEGCTALVDRSGGRLVGLSIGPTDKFCSYNN